MSFEGMTNEDWQMTFAGEEADFDEERFVEEMEQLEECYEI